MTMKIHDDEELVALLPELVDVDEIRMVKVGDDARFVEEHVDDRAIEREVREDPLDDDGPLEAVRTAQPAKQDLRHSADGEPAHDLVAPDVPGRNRSGEHRCSE
jgi:hypothetical protein